MLGNLTLTLEELLKESKCLTLDGLKQWLTINNIPYKTGVQNEPIVWRNQFNQRHCPNKNINPFNLDQGIALDRRCCGIYFLKSFDEIIYIGKTTTFFVRMAAHDKNGIDWDEVVFYPTAIKDLAALEKEMIKKYQPRLNKWLK